MCVSIRNTLNKIFGSKVILHFATLRSVQRSVFVLLMLIYCTSNIGL